LIADIATIYSINRNKGPRFESAMKITISILIAFLVIVALGSILYVQVFLARLQGSVRDKDGNPDPNVAVVLTNVRTGRTYSLKTDQNGKFVQRMSGGIYTIISTDTKDNLSYTERILVSRDFDKPYALNLQVVRGRYYEQLRMAETLWKSNNVAGAEISTAKLIKLDPNRWEGYGLAGAIESAQNRLPEAKAAYGRALELCPDNVKPIILQAMQAITTAPVSPPLDNAPPVVTAPPAATPPSVAAPAAPPRVTAPLAVTPPPIATSTAASSVTALPAAAPPPIARLNATYVDPTKAPRSSSTKSNRVLLSARAQQANLLNQVTPIYPPLAKSAHIAGTVVLHAIISTDGTIEQLEYVSGPPLLMNSAMDAVRQWRYSPTILNGKPTEVDTTISVVFSLGS
jgi:protein TonB